MEGCRTAFGKGATPKRRGSLSLFYLLLLTAMGGWRPSPAWAAEPTEYIRSLQDQAHTKDLASSRQWLLLGHWRKRFIGSPSRFISDVDGERFFLASDGKTHPESELFATLKAFAQPLDGMNESQHAQCRFLARREFLYKALQIDENQIPRLPCTELEAWKKRLGAEGVSVIFATAYMNNAASMFGHTFLKFHSRENKDERDLLNYGVSFWANTGSDGGIPFALFGLTGGYPGGFSLQPYHETLKDYANLEGRDVWEYRLNLDAQEIEVLLNHLFELQQTHFDYYFLDENCSYQILAALEVAKPALHLLDRFLYEVIPADSVRVLTREPGLVSQTEYRPALITRFKLSLARLSSKERDSVYSLVRTPEKNLAQEKENLKALSPPRQALVLDTALQYVDVLAVKDGSAYQQRSHRLKSARASLGWQALPYPPSPPSSQRPEQGHDPARFGLGFGSRDRHEFALQEFRFAYHHLLSDPTGYLENTHLEVMRLGVREYMNPSRSELNEVTVLDLISLAPSDGFFQPVAWRADLGLRRLADRPSAEALAFSLNGGAGVAAKPIEKSLLLFAFTQAHGDAGADLERGHRLGASVEAQALARPHRLLRLLAGTQYRWDFSGMPDTYTSHWLSASATLTRNWELRVDINQHHEMRENKAVLFAHFLL